MKREEISMKMHNDNGTLYRTMQEKAPHRLKRRIFIPTTGLNNIESSDPVGDMLEEVAEGVIEGVKETVETIIETKNMIDNFLTGVKKRAKRNKRTFLDTAIEEGIRLIKDSIGD